MKRTCSKCKAEFETDAKCAWWCKPCANAYFRAYRRRTQPKRVQKKREDPPKADTPARRLHTAAQSIKAWAHEARQRQLTRAEVLEVAALEAERDRLADLCGRT